jgi:hypothetical protein
VLALLRGLPQPERFCKSEIVRVLKPGAASVHNFPGPNNLMEGHVNLPFPWLCHSRAYLRLGAWIGWMRGIEPDWRRLARAWVDVMRFNNYPTKWRLRRIARSAGVAIRLASTDIDAGPRSKY